MKIALGINGACGRMSQRILALAHQDEQLVTTLALEVPNHPDLGRDIGELVNLGHLGVPVRAEIPTDHRVDVIIDFSSPEGTQSILRNCVARRIPLVLATTGHTAEQKEEIAMAAHETAILMAPNMSLAVNVLFELSGQCGRMLAGKGYDVEIIERHHRYKKDAPSGTAMHFAHLIQEAMGQKKFRHGREGLVGERSDQEIGIHAIRAGDNVGEHTIIFSALGETLELVHKGSSRDSYARGALQAAKYLANRPAGSYSMKDVLGL